MIAYMYLFVYVLFTRIKWYAEVVSPERRATSVIKDHTIRWCELDNDLLIIYMYSNSEVRASEIKGRVYCLSVSKTVYIGVILPNLLPSVGIDLPKPISSVHLNRWVSCAKTNPQCVNKQWPTVFPGGKTNYYSNNLFLKN